MLPLPDPGGVDQFEGHPPNVDECRDVVAGRARLLVDEFDVFASVDFRFSLFDDSLNLDLAGMYNFSQESVLLSPEVAYRFSPSIKGTLRAVYIDGPSESMVGQYKQNDQIQLRVRYSF